MHADQELFREKVPDSEIQIWMNNVIEEVRALSNSQEWINTGEVFHIDDAVLGQCVSMFTHVVPVVLAFENNFFEILTSFMKARQAMISDGRGLPGYSITLFVVGMVFQVCLTTTGRFDEQWSQRRPVYAGAIYLRCLTAPQSSHPYQSYCDDRMLTALQTCTVIRNRKFKLGEPCGDTYIASNIEWRRRKRRNFNANLQSIA